MSYVFSPAPVASVPVAGSGDRLLANGVHAPLASIDSVNGQRLEFKEPPP